MTQLLTIAEEQKTVVTLGTALILQAKVAILDNKPEDGIVLLEQAEKLSREKGLLQIQEKVKETRQEFVQLMEQQPGVQLQDTSISKKIELMKMEDYLKVAKQHVELGSSSSKEV